MVRNLKIGMSAQGKAACPVFENHGNGRPGSAWNDPRQRVWWWWGGGVILQLRKKQVEIRSQPIKQAQQQITSTSTRTGGNKKNTNRQGRENNDSNKNNSATYQTQPLGAHNAYTQAYKHSQRTPGRGR